MRGQEKQSFLHGALIIAAANFLVKFIGAVFKIPLDRFILHPEGMGLYNVAYNIYTWLFVVSTAGLPVAVSKLVAERSAKEEHGGAEKAFRVSLALLVAAGLFGSLAVFASAKPITAALKAEGAYLAVLAMSPALLFIAAGSAFRGYFQGRQNMVPTALSGIIEALGKLVFGLALGAAFVRSGVEYGAAGAVAGLSIGTILSLTFMILYYIMYKKNIPSADSAGETPDSAGRILLEIIGVSVPVTVGVSVFTLTNVIDTVTVMNLLAQTGIGEKERIAMFGYLGRAVTISGMPPAVIASLAVTIVPAVSAALERGNTGGARTLSLSALRVTAAFSLPCALGMAVLSEPILLLIYSDGAYYNLLTILGAAVIFMGAVQTTNALLQAYGRVWLPVRNVLLGAMLKTVLNLALVGNPKAGIYGAPMGTLLCYIFVALLNTAAVVKIADIKISFLGFIAKSLFSASVMSGAALFTYSLLKRMGSGAALLISIAVGAGVYAALMLVVRAFCKEDILLLPRGGRIAAALERMGLVSK